MRSQEQANGPSLFKLLYRKPSTEQNAGDKISGAQRTFSSSLNELVQSQHLSDIHQALSRIVGQTQERLGVQADD